MRNGSQQRKWQVHDHSTSNISADISMTGLKLEEVTSFKYLEATLCKDGTCSAENCIRLASAMAKLNRIQDLAKQHHQLRKQVQVKYKSLVTHILLSGCETWTLLADSEKMIQAFKTDQVPEETSLHFYQEHKTNDWVQSEINFFVGPQEPLLATLRRQKLAWIWACHMRVLQPLKNRPSGHLRGWVMPWSVGKMLDGQQKERTFPAHARTAYNGLVQKRLDEDLSGIICHVPLLTQLVKGLNCTVSWKCGTLWLLVVVAHIDYSIYWQLGIISETFFSFYLSNDQASFLMMAHSLQMTIVGKVDGKFLHACWWL